MAYIDHFYHLPDSVIRKVKSLTPYFTPFSEFVFYSHYSRVKPDGGQENWADVCVRVIEGVMSIRYDWYTKNHIHWDKTYWDHYAESMLGSMFRMEWSPPGRGLWAQGTQMIVERGAMALINCAMLTIEHNTWISDLCWIMDTLAFGVGVGFEAIRNDSLELSPPNFTYHHTIGDSREAWVDSLQRLLTAFTDPDAGLPIFDYHDIRPAGSVIKTMGGTASGPGPLHDLHDTVTDLCYKYIADVDYDSVMFLTDIANLIGVCIVSGNVRRSAQIAIGSPTDPVFLNLKNPDKYPYRTDWSWASNNSVKLITESDFDLLPGIAHSNIQNHDLGFLNMVNAPKGRIGKHDEIREDVVHGANPCLVPWGKVLTPNGIREIKDIHVGDLLWSETGWTKVLRKQSSGIQEVFAYHTSSGVFYGTKEHQILDEGWKTPVQYAETIDALQCPAIQTVEHDLQSILDGLLIGDGTKLRDIILLCIGQHDLDYFDSEIKDHIGVEYGAGQFKVVGTRLTPTDLPHTYARKIPAQYLFAKHDITCSFLRGLFSANGCVKRRTIELCAASFDVIHDVQVMLSSIGIHSTITVSKSRIQHFPDRKNPSIGKPLHTLAISSDRHIFQDKIGFLQKYKTDKLDQLCQVPLKQKTYKHLIKHSEYISTEEVFDITVDNLPHTFWYQGLNISNCGEIMLHGRGEVCNLSETFPTRCNSVDTWLRACMYASFYCQTVSLLPTHSPMTNAIVLKNRRIGVGLVDVTTWLQQVGVCALTKYLRQGYDVIRQWANYFADEAGVPRPIKVTTLKPSGTVAKVAGIYTSGLGFPNFDYMIRRVRIQQGTEICEILNKANVPHEPDYYSKNTECYSFPLYTGGLKCAADVSLYEQAMNLVLLQREYADNAISNTLSFREEEIKNVEPVLSAITPLVKSVSLLKHTDCGVFKQTPEERITKEKYHELISQIKDIDWSQLRNSDGIDEKYCTGDKCSLPGS